MKRTQPPWPGPFGAKAQRKAPPAVPEGPCAIVPPKGGTGQGESKGGTASPL